MTRLIAVSSLVMATSVSSTAFAQDLAAERLRELRLPSVCPALPTVAVLGSDAAGLLLTRLANASPQLQFVERQRLDDLTREPCLGPIVDPGTAVQAGGLLFAMYLIGVKSEPGGPVSVDVVRTDSGETIFHADGPPPTSMGALDGFLTSTVPAIRSAIAGNPYTCRNDFTTIITEDVRLACNGTLSPINTQYSLASSFTIEFSIDGVDYALRDTPQKLSGAVRVLGGKATTTLLDSMTRSSPRCAFTAKTSRTIAIALQPAATPASYSLTIPQNTSGEWHVSPLVGTTPPLFQGSATMQMSIATDPASNCDALPGINSQTTNYRHLELNQMRFGTLGLQPVCNQEQTVPAPFVRVPNLGVPGAADISAGCSVAAAVARVSLQRRF